MVVEPTSKLCFVQVTGNFLVCNSLEAHLQEIHLLLSNCQFGALLSAQTMGNKTTSSSVHALPPPAADPLRPFGCC